MTLIAIDGALYIELFLQRVRQTNVTTVSAMALSTGHVKTIEEKDLFHRFNRITNMPIRFCYLIEYQSVKLLQLYSIC
jgi:hypothetical protein